MINYSCKNSSGFSVLHIRKSRNNTAVTRAGLDGQQELLRIWRDLILEFHVPEILLIRKLLALRVDPLCYGKHPGCQREGEAPREHSTFQTPSAWFVLPFSQMLGGEAYKREGRTSACGLRANLHRLGRLPSDFPHTAGIASKN